MSIKKRIYKRALTKLPQERFLLSHIPLIWLEESAVGGAGRIFDVWPLKGSCDWNVHSTKTKKKKVTDSIPLGNTIFSVSQEVPPSDNLPAANEVLHSFQ